MTHFLSPVSEALDDTSLDPGVVVGFKVEIVVGMCLLSEHRSEDGGVLSLHLNMAYNSIALTQLHYHNFDDINLLQCLMLFITCSCSMLTNLMCLHNSMPHNIQQ